MKPLLIVDGYNVIGAWSEAEKKGWSLDESRDRLMRQLEDYAGFSGEEILLVFDGYQSERTTTTEEKHGDLTLIFTRHGETADSYIERAAAQTPRYRELRVATSDGLEQSQVLSSGAIRMTSRELLRELREMRKSGMSAHQNQPYMNRNTIFFPNAGGHPRTAGKAAARRVKRETRLAPPEKQVNSLSDDRMNAMNQDNDPMEQEEPMLPEDDAFLLDFPLRQAVPGEPEQPASVPLLSSSAAHSVYEGMTDEDVVALCRTGDSVAVEYLLNKYKNFVRSKARSYFLIGADHEDIVQEGMIGLYKAIRDFRPEKLASFRAFAELCITRQIITAIKTATRQKHIPLNSYVSLNKPLYDEESDRTLLDVCAEGHSSNPEELIISQEDLRGIHQRIDEVLSDLEQEVLAAYLDGKSYQEIADNLGRHVKSIDNALQRVKRKLERYLEDMEAQNND